MGGDDFRFEAGEVEGAKEDGVGEVGFGDFS